MLHGKSHVTRQISCHRANHVPLIFSLVSKHMYIILPLVLQSIYSCCTTSMLSAFIKYLHAVFILFSRCFTPILTNENKYYIWCDIDSGNSTDFGFASTWILISVICAISKHSFGRFSVLLGETFCVRWLSVRGRVILHVPASPGSFMDQNPPAWARLLRMTATNMASAAEFFILYVNGSNLLKGKAQ